MYKVINVVSVTTASCLGHYCSLLLLYLLRRLAQISSQPLSSLWKGTKQLASSAQSSLMWRKRASWLRDPQGQWLLSLKALFDRPFLALHALSELCRPCDRGERAQKISHTQQIWPPEAENKEGYRVARTQLCYHYTKPLKYVAHLLEWLLSPSAGDLAGSFSLHPLAES